MKITIQLIYQTEYQQLLRLMDMLLMCYKLTGLFLLYKNVRDQLIDVLIIGSGLSSLSLAYFLSRKKNLKILWLSKEKLTYSRNSLEDIHYQKQSGSVEMLEKLIYTLPSEKENINSTFNGNINNKQIDWHWLTDHSFRFPCANLSRLNIEGPNIKCEKQILYEFDPLSVFDVRPTRGKLLEYREYDFWVQALVSITNTSKNLDRLENQMEQMVFAKKIFITEDHLPKFLEMVEEEKEEKEKEELVEEEKEKKVKVKIEYGIKCIKYVEELSEDVMEGIRFSFPSPSFDCNCDIIVANKYIYLKLYENIEGTIDRQGHIIPSIKSFSVEMQNYIIQLLGRSMLDIDFVNLNLQPSLLNVKSFTVSNTLDLNFSNINTNKIKLFHPLLIHTSDPYRDCILLAKLISHTWDV